MTKITHILYDLGNTLLYMDTSWPQVFSDGMAGFGAAAEDLGLSINPQSLVVQFKKNMELYYAQREIDLIEQTSARILGDTLIQLGQTRDIEKITDILLSAFYACTQQHWKSNPSALPMLQTFGQRGFHQGILSNAAHDADVQGLVDQAGFRPHLDFVLTSAAIGFRKPHETAFQSALSRWRIPPGHVLMVGDTLNADILGANNSGITSVWMRQHIPGLPRNAPHTIRLDYEIDQLESLPALVDSLAG